MNLSPIAKNWTELEAKWPSMTLRGILYQALSRAVLLGEQSQLDEIECLVKPWILQNENNPRITKKWPLRDQGSILQRLLELASLAIAPVKNAEVDIHNAFEKEVFYYFSKGETRPQERNKSIRILLVAEENGKEQGITGQLIISLVKDGHGEIYRSTRNAFLITGRKFDEALDKVREFLTDKKIWPTNADVQWEFKQEQGKEIPIIEGPSLGGAFAIVLWTLLENQADCELDEIACTATIDPSGNLGKIGGLWEKLGPQCCDLAQRNYLKLVLVAHDQDGIPPEALQDNAKPRVIRVATIAEAIDKIREYQKPRQALLAYLQKDSETFELFDRSLNFQEHYQILPWLKEVPKSELPSAQSHELLRWEERMQKRSTSYTQSQWQDYFNDTLKQNTVPRFIVLGPPGSGKSTLMRYLAWQTMQKKIFFLNSKCIPVMITLRTWEIWVAQNKKYGLLDFLANYFINKVHDAPSSELWKIWLQNGAVFLLLDGLDELSGLDEFFKHAFQDALNLYQTCPAMVTCRTVNFEQYQKLSQEMPVFTLDGLTEDQRNQYIRKFPAKHPEHYSAKEIIQQIVQSPQHSTMRILASNPLLLSIFCYLLDDPRGMELPATRTQFYERTICKLLRREESAQEGCPWSQRKNILADIACQIFIQDQDKLVFSEERLLQAMRFSLQHQDVDTNARSTQLLKNFIGKPGLLRGDPEYGYFFLHLTFQEYLVALALAQKLNESSKEAQIFLGKEAHKIFNLLKKQMHHPRWHEVILFLLEQVQAPEALAELIRSIYPVYYIYENIEASLLQAMKILKQKDEPLFFSLVREICQEKNDDSILHHQLFLAAKIIAYTQSFQVPDHGWTHRIRKWMPSFFAGRENLLKRIRKLMQEEYFMESACNAYIALQAREYIDDVIPWLNPDVDHPSQRAACRAIAALGNRKHLQWIWPLLTKVVVATEACEVVKKFATKEDLTQILEILTKGHPPQDLLDDYPPQDLLDVFLHLAGNDAIAFSLSLLEQADHTQNSLYNKCQLILRCFSKNGTRQHLPLLLPYLQSKEVVVRESICEIIIRLVNHHDLPLILPLFLKNQYPEVRIYACLAVQNLGTRNDLEHLRPLLQDPSPKVRVAVYNAICSLGQANTLDMLLPMIEELENSKQLSSDLSIIIPSILKAIFRLGTAEHISWILRILKCCGKLKQYLRYIDEQAFARFTKDVDEEAQALLSCLLKDHSTECCKFACEIIAGLKKADTYLQALKDILEDTTDEALRRSSLYLLSTTQALDIGQSSEKIDIRRYLQHASVEIRILACDILTRIGTRQNIRDIARLIHDPDRQVRQSVCNFFEKWGTPEDMELLIPLLSDNIIYDTGDSFSDDTSLSWQAFRKHATKKDLPQMLKYLHDPKARYKAEDVIIKIADRAVLPEIFSLLQREDEQLQKIAYHIIIALGTADDIPAILELLQNKNWRIQRFGCWMIQELSMKAGIRAKQAQDLIAKLRPLLLTSFPRLRYSVYAAIAALQKIYTMQCN